MRKILVVDDDEDLLEMVTLVFMSRGMRVSSLNKGSGFFEIIEKEKPDIIIMDIYLGDADGRDLCRRYKESANSRLLPVILYSAGNIPPASIEISLADDFLQKPFDIGFLMKRVNQLLN
ncbi:MAG TPA: response regulator [Chitinophagaceae bacterium]|nr:response regulator [Chitinophagaceae bacterium]